MNERSNEPLFAVLIALAVFGLFNHMLGSQDKNNKSAAESKQVATILQGTADPDVHLHADEKTQK